MRKVEMEQLALVLAKIDEIKVDVSELKADQRVMSAVNNEQHGAINKNITDLTELIKIQNGRVTGLELWKNTISTKLKIVPATVSVIATGVTMIIGWIVIFH